jgi:hypothetical protein
VLFDVGHAAAIEKSENKGIEYRESMRSGPLTNLAGVLRQGDISSIVEFILDGPLLTDEFEEAKYKVG